VLNLEADETNDFDCADHLGPEESGEARYPLYSYPPLLLHKLRRVYGTSAATQVGSQKVFSTMLNLMAAVEANDLNAVEKLLVSGTNVNEKDPSSRNYPVIIAAFKGHDQILERLLEAGADLTVLDPGMNATALHAAAYAGRARAAQLLIQNGIAVDQKGPFNGYTALHDAVSQGHLETAEVLVSGGADVNVRNGSGSTALEMALSRQDTRMEKLLRAAG